MARFDLYQNLNDDGYLLDVQTDLLGGLNTRIVVPIMPVNKAPQPARRLNPVMDINGAPHVMVTQFMAAVPASILSTAIGNLAENGEEITNALEMVFFGF
jgi:toxin CcdB